MKVATKVAEERVNKVVNKVALEAGKHAAAYVLKGKNRVLGVCSVGCDHDLFQTRLQGMVSALVAIDANECLNSVLRNLSTYGSPEVQQLAHTLDNTIKEWAVKAQATEPRPQLVN